MCIFVLGIISFVHTFETKRSEKSVICKWYYPLFWKGVDTNESRKKCKGKEGSELSQWMWTDLKMELWIVFHVFVLAFSNKILCLPYHTVLGIFGMKLLATLHSKPFWDVNVWFILSNWKNAFRTLSNAFYCAILLHNFSILIGYVSLMPSSLRTKIFVRKWT